MARSSAACKRPSTSPSISRIGRASSLHLEKNDQCKGCGEWRKASSVDRLDPLATLFVSILKIIIILTIVL